jgi:CubicO group peptidase (beta-lactamase class C family)
MYPFILRATLIIFSCSLIACGNSQNLDIPPASPEQVSDKNLSWWSKAALQTFFDISVWAGSRSGFIAAFAHNGEVIHAMTSGYADIKNNTPMRIDTQVRIASMTKPITAVAAHILIEEGVLNLDDPVSKYIPMAAEQRVATSHSLDADGQFPTTIANELKVRHLLMFASGLGGGGDERDSDLARLWENNNLHDLNGPLQQRVEKILQLPLFEQPSTRWRYGASADIMARVIEVASGESFDVFLKQRIFDPLEMNATTFLPLPDQQESLAKVYTQDKNKNLVLAPKRINEIQAWTPGGGGLVSTVGDYMRFALMLWNKGTYNGVQILKPETVSLMTEVQITHGVLANEKIDGHGWGLGLAVVADADATPTVDSTGDFWWAGYFGTTFIVSPETNFVAIIISQNEPNSYSGIPFQVHIAPSIASLGL